MGSNPVEVRNFFRVNLQLLLSNCKLFLQNGSYPLVLPFPDPCTIRIVVVLLVSLNTAQTNLKPRTFLKGFKIKEARCFKSVKILNLIFEEMCVFV